MSYAISILFYGWAGENAVAVLKAVLGKQAAKHIKNGFDEKTIKTINDILKTEKIPLKCDVFKSSMLDSDDADEDSKKFYIHFSDVKNNTSDNDEDIGMQQFTLVEIKAHSKQSFEFKTAYPTTSKPSIINLIVAEGK